MEFSSVKSRNSITKIYLKPIHRDGTRDMDVVVHIGVLGSSSGFMHCCHGQGVVAEGDWCPFELLLLLVPGWCFFSSIVELDLQVHIVQHSPETSWQEQPLREGEA